MYQVFFTPIAVKDIEKLKAVHLDEKAKGLIELIKKPLTKSRRRMKNYLATCKDYIPEE